MITVEPFYSKYDMITLNDWLEARGISHVPVEEMPELGFMSFKEGRPVAAGFLRRCEGNYGIFDGLTTNPNVSGAIRHECIDAVVERIVLEAKKLGLKSIVALSVDDGTLMRAKRHGFLDLPHKAISLSLM